MSEAQIQRAIVAYLRHVLPGAIVTHVPNEGVRGGHAGYLDGARAKAMGQTAGFPDILILPFAHIGPAFLEVKTATGRTSTAQKIMHERLEVLGYRVAVVRSIDDARKALKSWGVWTQEAGE